jgi:hypothetical protein
VADGRDVSLAAELFQVFESQQHFLSLVLWA